MTPDERARLRELADRTPPGPWYAKPNDVIGGSCVMPVDKTPAVSGLPEIADFLDSSVAEFIAAARTAIPALLDALDAAEAELAELKRPPERCPSCGFPKNVRPKRMIGRKIVTCNNDFHNDDMEARGE